QALHRHRARRLGGQAGDLDGRQDPVLGQAGGLLLQEAQDKGGPAAHHRAQQGARHRPLLPGQVLPLRQVPEAGPPLQV
ncbi:MAG: hypothetical protein AVDCRST_MAG05-2842, partial [uncultured Rubrobacteraceae bacterium]